MRLATLAIIAALTIALTACGEPAPKSDHANSDSNWAGSDFKETIVKLKDGRSVLCVVSYREPSCDWEHAK